MKPRGRRGAVVQEKASSERANGGLRGAFRLWYKGPPAAFLSTFRRWKVDAVLRARRRGSLPRRAGAVANPARALSRKTVRETRIARGQISIID